MPRRLAILCVAVTLTGACSSARGGTQLSSSPSTPASTIGGTAATATPRPSPSTEATTTASAAVTVDAAVLQALAEEWLTTSNAPGVVLGARVGAGAPVLVSAGVDAKTGAPLPTDVPFSIASITKTFVGALALDLVDDGLMDLDDPVSRYVPSFPNADRITIRHLLTHTSGLAPQTGEGPPPYPYSQEFQDMVLANLERTFTVDEILAMAAPRPLLFEPGTGVRYSNVNTILLGKALADVAGTDLATALRARVLEPAGLDQTYFAVAEPGPPPAPGLFVLQDGGPVLNTADFPRTGFLSAIGAAGAMISTPADLMDWSVAFLRTGATSTDLSTSRFQVTPNGLGLGVIVKVADGTECVFAGGCAPGAPAVAVAGDGSVPGTNSGLAYFPALDLTILAIANTSEADVAEGLVTMALERIVPDAAERLAD